MTWQPAVPLPLLAVIAVVIVAARVVALRRQLAIGRAPLPVWRWCGLTFAMLLLVGAAAGPAIGAEDLALTQVADAAHPNVYLVVDRSPDMASPEKGGEDRMSVVRDDIAALIDRYPDARFGVITFASESSLVWPLSPDTWSLRPEIASVTPQPISAATASRINAGAASNVLRYQLIGARQQYPRAKNLVFYLGTGANGPDVPQREFDLPENTVDGGAVLGYGTDHEPALRAVADQTGVPYVDRSGSAPLGPDLPTVDVEPTAQPVAKPGGRTELYWALAGGAAPFLLIELYLVFHKFRRTRLIVTDVTA